MDVSRMGEPRKSNNQASIRLDLSAPVERTYVPDRRAILAALRIVLRSKKYKGG